MWINLDQKEFFRGERTFWLIRETVVGEDMLEQSGLVRKSRTPPATVRPSTQCC